ncbi:alpha-D-ribose 1-methylphosphonate 5-triphosphate diphosphatase [Pseudooceanicola sp. CBS1P-1]|uniref:Alpha-D-ribose 1-methylphosphonate 5-triphosphate diphosphatase n=1 Tax=Pseudooceanicola albus TaxID=2692189 RepID=A0A6L7GA03_9RHOB|nr:MULTISPECIES: alpha-D-ribose 1-methylphosphonate 5-triphosphate diphosphatase [Pseudooceanicola]MBT9382926.1 alpha-D-ribose 1-methylphosphonate 5-triphosphate diphosphatase [Pseudooceanicola endophyticus]MXN20150.1 alpha-D-ribose 1-methylphosphonate 5-triphosphate diphosphatase [Pseudooceanicola albus]
MIPFHFTGARVLRPGGLIETPVGITEGRIVDAPCGRAVDASGFLLLPGIVDPHGDGFERHLAPRRGAMLDMGDGLAMLAVELAANGITTAMLAQFWSWEGGMRGPDFARAMLEAHAAVAPLQAVDLRVQLRVESHLLDDFDAIAACVERFGVGYVVFNDHLPHRQLSEGRKPPRLTGQALKSGRSPEAHLALMQALHQRSAEVGPAVAALVARLPGVRFGSHDDDSAERRAFWRALGAGISEFPETLEAAQAAVAAGEPVIMGAPNVVRGASHAGKVSAQALIGQGLCAALASDYHYPAPRQGALKLAETMGLEAAWALVSDGPARVLGMTDRGRIEAGLRADLLLLDPETGRVGATVAGGRLAYLGPEMASRFFG